jgi:oxygen-dependent protoporphyrinogen oxidase
MSGPRHVAVLGGGVTGLAAAFRILTHSRGAWRVSVLEANQRAGGHAQTLAEDGFLIERGPNGFLENDASRGLVRALGIGHRVIEASRAAKHRFIVRGGRLREVPTSPLALLFGDALSVAGRLRVLREPWIGSRSPAGESVFEFAERRIGREAAEFLIDAAVGGITAGDSRALEVQSAFPMMVEMEREHGSLIRAMLRRVRADRAARSAPAGRPRLISFPRGVREIVEALESQLSDAVHARAAVRALAPAPHGWQLTCEDGTALEADAVVIATQARAASHLVSGFDAGLATTLRAIPFSGVAVVALAYPEIAIAQRLEGYGFLVPGTERGRILGALWESSIFEGRAPEGHALLRVMIGGARDGGALGEDDAALIARARGDLDRFMGLSAEPGRVWVSRAPGAIAQYTRGHAERVAKIREAEAIHAGLIVCGTSYDGVSLGSAMAAGARAADRVLAFAESEARPATPATHAGAVPGGDALSGEIVAAGSADIGSSA